VIIRTFFREIFGQKENVLEGFKLNVSCKLNRVAAVGKLYKSANPRLRKRHQDSCSCRLNFTNLLSRDLEKRVNKYNCRSRLSSINLLISDLKNAST
jgi:hypothetical protein